MLIRTGINKLCLAEQFSSAADLANYALVFGKDILIDDLVAIFESLLKSDNVKFWNEYLQQLQSR